VRRSLNQQITAFSCDDVNEMASSAMTRRKTGKRLRFTPEEIVRAIAGVEAAGLQVGGVEITSTGSIKISTLPKGSEAETDEAPRTNPDAARPAKKQA
jgi:hypothetical protein